MNILFYCPFKFSLDSNKISSLGGIETLNIELSKELAKKKNNIFLATYCKKKNKKNNVINIPIDQLHREIEKIKFDIVVSSNEPNIFDKFKSSKNILWMHNTLSIEKAFRKKKIFSILKNKIEVVFVSKYLMNKTTNFYMFNKKTIIDNFLSRRFYIDKINFNRKPIIVWSVQRERGLDETIEIWINKIYPVNKRIKFYIFGIEKNKYKRKIKLLKSKNIFLFGRVTKNILKKYYKKSLAMICLGYDETFCLNALEANSCGLPILTFGKTALKDYSINKYNGYIVNNYTDLSKKIISISGSKINKKIMLNSQRRSKNFNLDRIVKLWEKLFNKI